MKNNYLVLFLLIYSYTQIFAQVGINTTNPNSLLDITATDSDFPTILDGLLIPKINVFPTTNPTSSQHSMLVYLNADLTNVTINDTAKDYSKGFYYWDHNRTDWMSVTSHWKLDGNSGTTSGVNYIGTSDSAELDFRVNNTLVSRFTEKGQFELSSENQSVFIGTQAGENYDPSLGAFRNTYIGYQAGMNGTSARDNLAVGAYTLKSNTTGRSNIALGTNALTNFVDGENNTAIGEGALESLPIGDRNIVIGTASLSNLGGYSSNNVVLGNFVGDNLTSFAYDNVFIGTDHNPLAATMNSAVSLGYSNYPTGDYAITIGHQPSAAQSATAIGLFASASGINAIGIGTDVTSDFNSSIAIGHDAVAKGDSSIAIGFGAVTTSANEVVIGNASVSSIGGYTTWSNLSDGRFKYDVTENVPGLDFIKDLRPVTYKVDQEKINTFLGNETTTTSTQDKVESGFIAQEVKALADKLNYDFNGVIAPQDESKQHYKISYSTFVVPLIKATQEQQVLIDKLLETIEKQEKTNAELENRLKILEQKLLK